jgi:hypothetical protein
VYTYYMITVDNLLLKIVNFTSPTIEEQIQSKDSRVLRSLASSIASHVFITENQGNLLMKILRENQKKMTFFSDEIAEVLKVPEWSRNFRLVEQVKKMYISKNEDNELSIQIEFTFNSEIRRILQNLTKKAENLIQASSGKVFTADLTEQNIVLLVEALEPLEFDIVDTIKNHYATIKSWSKTDFESQFYLTTMTNQNFHKSITADLGVETPLDQNIINDRSVRYQYLTENVKNPGENLTEYMANRSVTKVWVDKNQHTLSQVLTSLIALKRLPLLFVFDNMVNEKYYQNLEILSKSLDEAGLTNDIGVYFRLPNDDLGKRFNSIIAEKKYNSRLDDALKVAVVMGGKIPKFFLTSAWRPMSVIALDTKMGLRHGKTSVYTNCCDLIIEYSDETSVLEERKLSVWR